MDLVTGDTVAGRQQQGEAIYRRRKLQKPNQDLEPPYFLIMSDHRKLWCSTRCVGGRVSVAALDASAGAIVRKNSWSRSLSTRGRTSIAIGACFEYHPPQKEPKRRGKIKEKDPLPKGNYKFEEEKVYFQEVDAFDLLVESPSPKPTTWVAGNQADAAALPKLCSPLDKGNFNEKLPINGYSKSSISLLPLLAHCLRYYKLQPFDLCLWNPLGRNFTSSSLKTWQNYSKFSSRLPYTQSIFDFSSAEFCVCESGTIKSMADAGNDGCEDIEASVKKLSLGSSSSDSKQLDPFGALLRLCGQSAPLKFGVMFFTYWQLTGEWGGAKVLQTSKKMLEEVIQLILSRTLNCLRGHDSDVPNACTTFIETIDVRVCQGSYDAALIKAWEDWDEKCGSENDHPKAFPDNQSETYRKMKKFPQNKCNMVDIPGGYITAKEIICKFFSITFRKLLTAVVNACDNDNSNGESRSKDERDLRSLKKHLGKYQSAREALLDPSFGHLVQITSTQ
ncbi:hypothetical protein DVH24_036451 [Malus domestica]|uniref:Uncharacterized protein n=1 Tax=Malus domestica TaxID=3750 RepID=A0A498IFY5_MALDO|nr:hypothetical protein DVH24_036451 [Malus domestica]